MSISQVRYLYLCHYVLTIALFEASAKTIRDAVKYVRYFVSVEQSQLNFSKVRIL